MTFFTNINEDQFNGFISTFKLDHLEDNTILAFIKVERTIGAMIFVDKSGDYIGEVSITISGDMSPFAKSKSEAIAFSAMIWYARRVYKRYRDKISSIELYSMDSIYRDLSMATGYEGSTIFSGIREFLDGATDIRLMNDTPLFGLTEDVFWGYEKLNSYEFKPSLLEKLDQLIKTQRYIRRRK